MKNLIIVITILLASIVNSNAENRFCLEADGFVYPIFESPDCEEENHERITKKEFSYIIDFEQKLRKLKLDEYRENFAQIEADKEKKLSEEIIKTEKKKNLSISGKKKKKIDLEKKKKELEQKKLAKLAKEQKLKEERKRKNEKRIAENKKRQEERKREILARQEEIKKKKEELKKQKIAKKKLAKEKQLKKEKERELKLAKIKTPKKKESKYKKEIIEKSETVNNNLKIIYLTKNIVKNELLPSINPSSDIDFSKLEALALDKNSIKNLFANNNNLILIIPRDYETFSSVVFENEKTSQLIAGTKSVPNPEFNRLQAEMRRAERELYRAQAEAERGFQMSQCMSCGLITQWGGVALQSKWQKEGQRLQNILNNLISSYSNTPDYLEKEVLRNYNYFVQDINAEKKAIFRIIQSNNNKCSLNTLAF